MKKILIVAAIFIGSSCFAQNQFFQIIAFKGNVTLDSISITCGQKIDKPDQILVVGKGGYVSVLTSNGYAFQLGRGKHKVKSILEQTSSNLTRINSSQTGAVHRLYPDGIKVLSVGNSYEYASLGGDTLTIIWQKKSETHAYSVELKNFLEEVLLDTAVLGNVLTLAVKDKFKSKGEALFFQIKAGKLASRQILVKRLRERQDFLSDASCTASLDFIERELLLAGLCEIYNLYNDQIHHLFNLYAYSKKTRIKISHAYYYRMLQELKFEEFFTEQ